MRPARGSDLAKILAYLAGSLFLGALLAPWLHNLGKGLVEITHNKHTNFLIAWLAGACERAGFPRYFQRAVMLAAALLFPPVFQWLKVGRSRVRFRDTPWSLRLPDSVVACNEGQPLGKNPHGPRDAAIGFLMALSPLVLFGAALVALGWFHWQTGPSFSSEAFQALGKALPVCIGVGFAEEVVFRGVLLGIFLRAMRPATALVSLSLLFAALHFLHPPPGFQVDNPDDINAGFVLLRGILIGFADPLLLLGGVVPLLAVGLVLGYARLRTASLWLPVGIHAGWICGVMMFNALTYPAATLPPGTRFFVGSSLREGILPLAIVVATGFAVHVLTRRNHQPRDHNA